jgi:hypothetical protein
MTKEHRAAYPDESSAERAIEALVANGVPRHAIEKDPQEVEAIVGPPVSNLTGAHRRAIGFGVAGAVLGGIVAVLVSIGVIAEPVLSLLGTNPAMAAVRGVVGGGAIGVLFGYILGMGEWEDVGEPSPEATDLIGVVLRVAPGEAEDLVAEVFKRTGGQPIRR